MELLDEYGELVSRNIERPEQWEETLVFETCESYPYYKRVQHPLCIDGTMTNVYKEHNFKYCECKVGCRENTFWTGDACTECKGRRSHFETIELASDYAILKCPASGYNIVILRSTKEEINETGYFITPVHKWPLPYCGYREEDKVFAPKPTDGLPNPSQCPHRYLDGGQAILQFSHWHICRLCGSGWR